MADIFISYSKKHSQLTEALARDLEAEGYTTWWDTNLLPDNVFFPETIRTEIKAARAVIVIWAEHSVTSRWVYSEATEGDEQDKLLQVRDEALDARLVPMPFKAGNISIVSDRAKILAALARLGVTPSGAPVTTEQKGAARYKGQGRIEIRAPFIANRHGRWFLPGAGKTEWFQDLETGPEMVVVPQGPIVPSHQAPPNLPKRGTGKSPAAMKALSAAMREVGNKYGDQNLLNAAQYLASEVGSQKDEPQRESRKAGTESPLHEIMIPKPFAVGRCAVTRGQFATFVAATRYKMDGGARVWTGKEWTVDPSKSWRNPSFAQDDSHPVVCVSWEDTQAYCGWLSMASDVPYRLLSETELEYVCRAGRVTPFLTPDGSAQLYEGGSKKEQYRNGTAPAKSFEANPWGIYQVLSNVFEWCGELHDNSPGGMRAFRGRRLGTSPQDLRTICTYMFCPDYRVDFVGFRVARAIAP
jgi:formylglycine-generating enzyme required for sulfatase activity